MRPEQSDSPFARVEERLEPVRVLLRRAQPAASRNGEKERTWRIEFGQQANEKRHHRLALLRGHRIWKLVDHARLHESPPCIAQREQHGPLAPVALRDKKIKDTWYERVIGQCVL